LTGRAAADILEELRLDEDLGLSSLDRMELMTQLENQLGIEFDENQFVGILTVQELETTCHRLEGEPQPLAAAAPGAQTASQETSWEAPGERLPPRPAQPAPREAAPHHAILPRWTRSAPVRWARALLLETAILPMVRELVRLRVEGRSRLHGVEPPVIFVANHVSHFDTPVVLAALPWRWRRRVAPAMSQDFFRSYFEPRGRWDEQRWQAMGEYYLACGLFNAYPLPQKLGGTRRALQYTGELIDQGYCPLVFPEGTRSPTGNLQPFKPGIALMAQRLRVPVVPIFIEGLFEIYSVHHEWPREGGPVSVTIGDPLRFDLRQDSGEITRLIEQALRALGAS
jgi:long-chain acyl-CoA synthetase